MEYPEIVQRQLDDLESQKKQLEIRKNKYEKCSKYVEPLEEIIKAHNMQPLRLEMTLEPQFQLSIYTPNLDSVAEVLRDIAKTTDFKRNGDPMDVPTIPARVYPYKSDTARLGVNFWLKTPDDYVGKVCKYVQTGIREEPIYELQCEGGDDATE